MGGLDVRREYLVVVVEVDVINVRVPGSPKWMPGEKWVTLRPRRLTPRRPL